MAATLNQLLGIEAGVKTAAENHFTEVLKTLQRSATLAGMTGRYEPVVDGEDLPAEGTQLQVRTEDLLRSIVPSLSRMLDVVASKDATNATATADVVTEDGEVILRNVHAVTLLTLENKLRDLHTLMMKLPRHDPSQRWHWNSSERCWETDEIGTVKTKAVLRNHVVHPGTDKHPPQVQTYTENIKDGTWWRKKFTGALPSSTVDELLASVEAMHRAVRQARERANMVDVTNAEIGEAFLNHLFRPLARIPREN